MLLFRSAPYPHGYYDTKVIDGIQATDVNIPSSDGVKLHGRYFKVPNSKYVFLMHHGNGGNLSVLGWYADLAIKSGASILLYDYRGYGQSSGESSMNGIREDAQAAYNYLTGNQGWQPQQLVNLGLSLGTGPAFLLSQEKECAGTVLIAPYTSLQGTCGNVLPWLRAYPALFWPEPDINIIDSVHKAHPPLLVFHGDEDSLIPISHSYELRRRASAPFELVTLKCGHGDLGRVHDLIQSKLNKFVDELNAKQLAVANP